MKGFSRRDFIKQNTLTGLGIFAFGSMGACTESKSQAESLNSSATGIKTIGGMPLEELHERYRKELFNRFLPNMEQFVIDHECGGFMCDFDISSRKAVTTNKKTWFQGRGIWVYSFLYNNFDKNPEYLEIARKGIDFILKLKPSDDNFWNNHFSREGVPLSGPGDIYGNLFVAEGLAEYAKATGEKEYLTLAKEIIFYCLERYDRPDYVYDISYAPGNPKIEGPRVLGHWMLFLSLSTQILSQGPDSDFEKLADRCIDAILNHHINPEHNVMIEVINHDLSIPDKEFVQFSVIGHSIETIAFVMAEAVRRKDPALFMTSKEAFRRHLNIASDPVYGGYFEVLFNVNNVDWALTKSAWCQQEVLIGSLLLVEQTGEEWAQKCFIDSEAYVQAKMVRPDYAFWTFGGERKVDSPSTKIVEHYHTPRYLMRNMLALERMMKRDGNVSGLFA